MQLLKNLTGAVLVAVLTYGCGGAENSTSQAALASPNDVAPSFFPGTSADVPQSPSGGVPRLGQSFDAFIQSPASGEKVAISVFEPTTVVGGQKYPLLVNSHGWNQSRVKAADKNLFKTFLDAGYGVITFDQRGWGESGGTIRAMDPDADGPNMLAVLDWAEANLDWLAYGVGPEGADATNLILGSFGGSYGGMYQMLMYNIDPKRRLDAMQIQIAPNNLPQSIFPGGVPKTIWKEGLFATALTGRIDPYMANLFLSSTLSAEQDEFLRYHSNAYFCESLSVKTNGGPGTSPRFGQRDKYPIDVVISQGVRDTLFDLTQGIKNYECFKKLGGDVRFLSMQNGHNNIPIVPDTGNTLYFPPYAGGTPTTLPIVPIGFPIPGNQNDSRCGPIDISSYEPQRAFFDEHLKGMEGAAQSIPKQPCLSIASGDSVLVGTFKSRATGNTAIRQIPPTTIPAGLALNVPVAIELGIVGGDQTTVIGGIPHAELLIKSLLPGLSNASKPTVFLGLGQSRLGVPGVWDLINNQLTPVRGTGQFNIDLVAVTARLAKGEKLALLVYGLQDQFAESPLGNSLPQPISIEGKVGVPVLGAGEFQPYN